MILQKNERGRALKALSGSYASFPYLKLVETDTVSAVNAPVPYL